VFIPALFQSGQDKTSFEVFSELAQNFLLCSVDKSRMIFVGFGVVGI